MKDYPTSIILAGGLGKRLWPITKDTPKPLIKVSGVPVIDYVIANLRRAESYRTFVNVHYLYEKVIDYLKSEVVYFYEPTLLGTAGTIRALAPYQSENFIVCNGDTITNVDIRAMYEMHKASGKMATLSWDKKCTGVMIFNRAIFDLLPEKGMIDDALQNIIFNKYWTDDLWWIDIGTQDGLKEAQSKYVKKLN